MPSSLRRRLEEADELLSRERWAQASEMLEEIDESFPGRPEVFQRLAEAYHRLNDWSASLRVCRRLAALRPEDREVQLMLAACYQHNNFPVLAFSVFQQFLSRWPEDPRCEEIAKTAGVLEKMVSERLTLLGLEGGEGLELGAWHEEIQCLLDQREYADARCLAERLLARRPNFVPALNNMADAYFLEGYSADAIATEERVLAVDPANCHAMSNLTRYLCLSGRAEEAKAWAERLKSLPTYGTPAALKKAEALTFLGDDQGVWQVYEQAKQEGQGELPGLLYHLAATAAARLGRIDEAKSLWKQAVRSGDAPDYAAANLANLKLPVGERHAPWAYDLAEWLPALDPDELLDYLVKGISADSEQACRRLVRRYLERHPYVAAIVPMLLDRGGPDCCWFAVAVASLALTPELNAALREFALSQRGPDELRYKAALSAMIAGVLPPGVVRLWVKGRWEEVVLVGFEIHSVPFGNHSQRVEDLLQQALFLLNENEGFKAEELLKKALEIEPRAPDILNNLAKAYAVQGRDEESLALIRRIREEYPDYLFGRVNWAHHLIQSGEIEQARDLIEPLMHRRRLHVSEFSALCGAQAALALAKGHREAANAWIDMLEEIDPNDPSIAHLRRRVTKNILSRLLGGLLPKRPSKSILPED